MTSMSNREPWYLDLTPPLDALLDLGSWRVLALNALAIGPHAVEGDIAFLR